MKRRSTKLSIRKGLSIIGVLLVSGMGTALIAQPAGPPPAPQAQAQPLNPQQLDNLVAPVALYPDPLLGQVMAASTYPVELVEAQQWLQNNSNLQGQQLTDAARQQNWDASVQAMVAMPDVLAKLNQDIRWTTDLGNAFLAQPADVMSAVQRLRARAQANGKLQSGPQETVTTASENGQQAIEIEPANPQVVFVPNYDPVYVWGPPAWGYYPPLYYPAFGFGWYPGIDMGFCFGGWGGWGLGFGGFGWGWGPNWFGGGLFVNAGFFNHYGYHYGSGFRGGLGRVGWEHDPGHRLGVGYPNHTLTSRFGAASQASRIQSVRAGNYSRFGSTGGFRGNNVAPNAGNGFRGGSTPQTGRNFQGTQGGNQRLQGAQQQPGTYQRFQGGRQTYQPPAAQHNAPSQGQRNFAPSGQPGQRFNAPAMQQRNNAPAQRYSAPAQHYSAPSFGGGGARSFGGGGGGGAHVGGGGGGSHGGGGGHGGGRR